MWKYRTRLLASKFHSSYLIKKLTFPSKKYKLSAIVFLSGNKINEILSNQKQPSNGIL